MTTNPLLLDSYDAMASTLRAIAQRYRDDAGRSGEIVAAELERCAARIEKQLRERRSVPARQGIERSRHNRAPG